MFLSISNLICIGLLSSHLVAAYVQTSENKLEKCGACDRDKCPRQSKCNLGIVKDRCGCCEVCGLEEFQLCNLPEDWIPMAMGRLSGFWHGKCGEGLECRLRKDVEPKLLQERQAICYCMKEGVVCGSDGNTYSHCKMDSVFKSTNGAIKKISEGPCKSVPKILTISESMVVNEGERVSLACEIQGFPIPTATWFFSPPNKMHENTKLPGDADEISVSLRGGPQITRLTSHLQINKVEPKHEGSYQCMAENDLGMKAASVSLTVIPNPANRKSDYNDEQSNAWFGADSWASDEM